MVLATVVIHSWVVVVEIQYDIIANEHHEAAPRSFWVVELLETPATKTRNKKGNAATHVLQVFCFVRLIVLQIIYSVGSIYQYTTSVVGISGLRYSQETTLVLLQRTTAVRLKINRLPCASHRGTHVHPGAGPVQMNFGW